jgi:hippurate hydrolase
MNIAAEIRNAHEQLKGWRHDIHAHPETAFDEHRTADFIANKLQEFGLDVHRGLAKTGVIGTLKRGTRTSAIGLRADMDALFIQEAGHLEYKSTVAGKMHACGHDGHSTMLLGAAQHLAKHGQFDGIVHFIFQPAEETGDEMCGGNAMVQDGLFEKFPVSCVFGLHNFPGLAAGHFAVRSGPMLASIDTFEFKILSKNTHPALQYEVPDPILIAARIIQEAHAFKARYINPAEPAILTITQIKCGDPHDRQSVHVTPDEIFVRGTTLTFNDDLRDTLERGLRDIVSAAAAAAKAEYVFKYERGYPALVNAEVEKQFAVKVAQSIVGAERVEANMFPVMAAEDFAFMLKKKPGCYVFLGNGDVGEPTAPCQLHNPNYNFNDDIIPVGVQYWTSLVENYLPR